MTKMSKMHKRVISAHGAMLALSAALPIAPAFAQTTESNQSLQLQSVTVTAQRRTENIRDVPVSVTALKGDKLDVLVSGGDDIRLLAGKVPSLNVESSNGRTFPRFYIRGYGNTDFNTFASQPVSLVYDDIVQENPILKGFPIFDLASVEVLRGPQGTLFGRNTPAGVVKFESEKPNLKKVEGYYNLSAASHYTMNAEGAVNVPLSTNVAMRVSAVGQHRDDYVNNFSDVAKTRKTGELDGYNEHAERVQFLYSKDGFSGLLGFHQRQTNGSARLFRANLIKKGSNTFADGTDLDDIVTNAQNFQSLKTNGINLRLQWDLGNYKLHSITGYEHIVDYSSRGDIDGGTPAGPGFIPFQVETNGYIENLDQYTQEFRLESAYAGPFNWQTGLYFFDEDVTGGSDNFNSTTYARTSRLRSNQKNEAWAAFASASYDLTPDWTVRGGLRYTKDEKDFRTIEATNVVQIGPSSVKENKDKISWDVSATYKVTPTVNVYGRAATGFRAPSIAAASAEVPITIADSETIKSFELGVKADLFDRRARTSFSIYDYTIEDQQLTVVGGNSNVNRLINADKTKGKGAEFDFEAAVSTALRVSAGASYNYTQIRDGSLSVNKCAQCTITNPLNALGRVVIDGNPLPQAPRWTFNATARYGVPFRDGELYVFTDWSYRSKINFFLYEATEFTGAPLTEGGVRVGYIFGNGKYEVAAFGRNILDQRRITGAIDFNNLTGFTNEPRQWGMQFKGNF
ncbi:TonB-dependent receptor [Massilia sp. CFBP9012]|uniref:TonB-dependent receptor n=1 Tax=Massilia sp. CFBP9012 TaxID=3096531 RepID=UPI002A6A5B55|nr:TonB-dependent receptor [Massilia sp. CFBP9012]MDY0975939.1 TonB-dependent receptor [Massilia sp. CFBP9012]